MDETTIDLHTAFRIGDVDPRIFGGFLEHMGRAVYEGVFEPGSPHADEHGFRKDVLGALERMQMPVIRYPGGNFVSGYHWQDGVGPAETRPTVRDLAWQSIETNQVGTDEFVTLCRKLDWTPMLAVNLGTGTPEEARNWVEYCNSPAGTRFADLRAENGNEPPHGVPLWCLGNEMDGPWQLGHVPAEQYAHPGPAGGQDDEGRRPHDRTRGLRHVPSRHCPATCTGTGSSSNTVGDFADYISLHRYVDNRADDTADFLAVTNSDRSRRSRRWTPSAASSRQSAEEPQARPTCASTNGTSGTRTWRWTARASTRRT